MGQRNSDQVSVIEKTNQSQDVRNRVINLIHDNAHDYRMGKMNILLVSLALLSLTGQILTAPSRYQQCVNIHFVMIMSL